MQEQVQGEHKDDAEELSVTQHEPHQHARSRVFIGVGSVAVVLAVGIFVWSMWGEEIKEACTGDGEVCTVELPDAPSEGGVDFNESFVE